MQKRETESNVTRVRFHEPVDGKTDYYFGSLKAIYLVFTPEEVGCSLTTLYSAKVSRASYKVTDKCVITKCPVVRNKRGSGGDEGDE